MFENVEAFYRPGSIPEALRLFQTGNGAARFLAGGTDLINQADRKVRTLIDLSQLGLSYVRKNEDGWVIGATTTIAELESAAVLRKLAGGILQRAAAQSGPLQVRNMATIGGRLLQPSASAEIATVLLALDATVVLACAKRRMKIPLVDLSSSDCKMLLLEIAIPTTPSGGRWSFEKLGRVESDISLVNVAAGLQTDRKGTCKWARIAVGGLGKCAAHVRAAESLLVGRRLNSTLIDVAADAVAAAVHPVSSIRGSADYLREMAGVLTRRALAGCV